MARVLLVDDDTDASGLFRRWLERAGHEVSEFATGEGALRTLTEAEYDLILLDVYLPGIGGYEVARRIAENPKSAHVPIVMISVSEREDRPEPANIRGWMLKPFTSTEMLETVKRLAGETHG